jgi:hypothetical protein
VHFGPPFARFGRRSKGLPRRIEHKRRAFGNEKRIK